MSESSRKSLNEVLRTGAVRSISETRCKYVPVSSLPASLRGTVSEADLTTRVLDRGSRILGMPRNFVSVVALMVSVAVLSSCAVQRGVELPVLSDWETRQQVLGAMSDWGFSGRIGVSAGDEGFNGTLRWHQVNDGFSATVSGPLGVGTLRISGVGGRVTIIDGDGVETELADAEADLRAMYGWTIPVGSLRYWALGIPDPDSPAVTEVGERGQLLSLEQGGWRVDIPQYREGAGQLLPRRMNAVNGDAKVRLVIDHWSFF